MGGATWPAAEACDDWESIMNVPPRFRRRSTIVTVVIGVTIGVLLIFMIGKLLPGRKAGPDLSASHARDTVLVKGASTPRQDCILTLNNRYGQKRALLSQQDETYPVREFVDSNGLRFDPSTMKAYRLTVDCQDPSTYVHFKID